MKQEHPQELYQALIDEFECAVLVVDDHATYVWANKAACEMLRCPRDGIIGHHLSEFIIDGTRGLVDAQWQRFLHDGVQSGIFPLKVGDDTQLMTRFNARANVVPGLHCSFLTPEPVQPGTDQGRTTLLTVCAWTNRVKLKERWVSLGEYLYQAHGVTVTHGICPDVAEKYFG